MKAIVVLILFIAACAPSGPHKPVGESPQGGELSSAGYDSVKPVFARFCAACHPSRHGPDWLDYAQASEYARNGKLLLRIARERSMPPPGTSQAAAISETERMALAGWARAGGPRESRAGPMPQPEVQEPSPQMKLVQKCLTCHGANGSDPSSQPRIPILAGQNEKYLAGELRKFWGRRRIDPTNAMNDVAIDLSEDEIQSVAKYFASRSAHANGGTAALPESERSLFDRGARIAARDCISCHRNPEFGNRPTSPELPSLSGQSKIYLINQLVYFRGSERANPLMRELARNLKDEDILALAVYFANVN